MKSAVQCQSQADRNPELQFEQVVNRSVIGPSRTKRQVIVRAVFKTRTDLEPMRVDKGTVEADAAPLKVGIGRASDSDLRCEILSTDLCLSDQQHDRSCWHVNCARYGQPYLTPRQRDRSTAEFTQLTGYLPLSTCCRL